MVRVALVIISLLAMATLFLLAKGMNTAVTVKRYDFTEEEIASGQHCIHRFLNPPYSITAALDQRLGEKIDGRTSVRVDRIILGALKPDGFRKVTVLYWVVRIGEAMGPQKKATGMLTNNDCSFKLTVIQR